MSHFLKFFTSERYLLPKTLFDLVRTCKDKVQHGKKVKISAQNNDCFVVTSGMRTVFKISKGTTINQENFYLLESFGKAYRIEFCNKEYDAMKSLFDLCKEKLSKNTKKYATRTQLQQQIILARIIDKIRSS